MTWPSYVDVLAAYKSCRYRKSAGHAQTRFERRLGANLGDLHRDLVSRQYQPGRSVRFVVSEPKAREIFAASFRDRVVHHLLVSELEKIWERKLSPHAHACITGRGSHSALRYASTAVKSLSRGGRRPVFALQVDIATFFITIHRPTLLRILLDSLPAPQNPHWLGVHWLTEVVTRHDARTDFVDMSLPHLRGLVTPAKSWVRQGPDFGIPIGNLTSQFAANATLTGLDHYVARQLKPGAYARYMDDLLLLGSDRDELGDTAPKIDSWLRAHRHQSLHPQKTKLTRLDQGILFLGYRLRQTNSPAQPLQILLPTKKAWDFVQACRQLESQGISPPETIDRLFHLRSHREAQKQLSKINSRLGFIRHARSFRFRRRTLKRLTRHASIKDAITVRPDGTAITRT